MGTAAIAVAAIAAVPVSAKTERLKQSLTAALTRLAVESHVPMLFDQRLTDRLRARPFRRSMTTDQALSAMLQGTGLAATKSASGVYTINEARKGQPGYPTKVQQPTSTIPDIFVFGRATSNVDLPRSEDDIEPYQVLSSQQIDGSLAHTASELLSEQLTMNLGAPQGLADARRVTPDSPGTAIPGSYVDLNGFGPDQTLVLIDGHRLPGVPGYLSFPQSDIGALAPQAIDRIETLGLPAGAIFGVDATGGAINVVLKHDYRGIDLSVLNGLSQRGDDASLSIEGKAGFETGSGRTKGMIRLSYSSSEGDVVGSRAVGIERLQLFQKIFPGQYIEGNDLFIFSTTSSVLQLKPAYGGISLGSYFTQIPLGSTAQSSIALLRANAGLPVTSLSDDGAGYLASLQPVHKSLSITANARQAIGANIELFADAILLRNATRTSVAPASQPETDYDPSQTQDPFVNPIGVLYPLTGLTGVETDIRVTGRLTAGVIVRPARGWTADADFAVGKAEITSTVRSINAAFVGPDILAPGTSLSAYLGQYKSELDSSNRGSDVLFDGNVRVAGRLIRLPGGTATLTATGEWRQDKNPGLFSEEAESQYNTAESTDPPQRETVASGYIELRLPVLPEERGLFLTRGLKLQIAARGDSYSIVVPKSVGTVFADYVPVDNHQTVLSYIVGGSVEPTTGMMVRASYAVGFEPPKATQLFNDVADAILPQYCDYFRGGCSSHDDGTFKLIEGGNPQAKAQRTQSISVGVVLKPAVVPGLRLSIDYNHLLITHALIGFELDQGLLFLEAHEAEFPGRVIRAPLTAADRLMGYTVGKLEEINIGLLNEGRAFAKTIDGAFEYRHSVAAGSFTLYGRGTWEPTFIKTADLSAGPINLAGTYGGPLRVRGSGGINWQKGPADVTLNAQYYGGYTTAFPTPDGQIETAHQQFVGGKVYFDLALGITVLSGSAEAKRPLRFRFAIRNILDRQPSPIASSQDGSTVADPYADYIGRRFELGISTRF